MRKRTVAIIMCAVLALSALFALTACDSGKSEPTLKIVYLGDSIGEALLGPSPLSERDNYGYYALIGKRNNYEYVNRAVSGHKTGAMLKLISKEDDGALLIQSHIKTADIIHVSILGNDMLQEDVGKLIHEVYEFKTNGTPMTKVDSIISQSKINFAGIVAKLRELNPKAVIMFQTVYNPLYPHLSLFLSADRSITAEVGWDPDKDWQKYHELAGELIDGYLNKVARDYAKDHPEDKIHIIDAYAAFEKEYQTRGAAAASVIYPDGVHPSNEGHAIMADLIQAKLEELGLADGNALKSYKSLRKEMIARLYPDLNVKQIKSDIDSANSCSAVTSVYFRAIDGATPKYM